jgi:hypothetical protein
MKIRIRFLSFFFTVLVMFLLISKYNESATKDEYLFSMDMLKTFKYTILSQKARGDITWIQGISKIAEARQNLQTAVEIMGVWTDNPDEDIKRISSGFIGESSKIIEKFIKVESVYENSKKDWIKEYEVIIPWTEQGYNSIYELIEKVVTVVAQYKMYDDGKDDIIFNLSVSQLASLLRYIENNFQDEFRQIDSNEQLKEIGMANKKNISRSAQLIVSIRDFIINNSPIQIKM